MLRSITLDTKRARELLRQMSSVLSSGGLQRVEGCPPVRKTKLKSK